MAEIYIQHGDSLEVDKPDRSTIRLVINEPGTAVEDNERHRTEVFLSPYQARVLAKRIYEEVRKDV